MTITVLLVDDHPVIRAGIRAMLHDQPELTIVGEAVSGSAALAAARELTPDVVLMDLRMPDGDGVGATEAILAELPATRVVILTTYRTDGDILRAVEAGAVGYLLKDTSPAELAQAVRAAARGETVLSPAVAATLLGRVRQPRTETLSRREAEVLRLVAEGLTNAAVGRALHITEATVKTYVVRIFTKLGVSDRTAAVMAAVQAGIL
ncbi:response regulator transcription factor [Streptomyces sp. BE20]|uniref:response regulator transcription factor n=1 Tax=Streptomycetaceae TaxID=2062 RepID=UPI002E78879F|nr:MULTISPECIES: response regulator transcription factor [unclassified Streptomyces]MED7948925.1 response regulator transcription factor [Streptomyces sp. BE303]MEE1825232.1 response regulator transcription factor [Streptomyces sp. BE20]